MLSFFLMCERVAESIKDAMGVEWNLCIKFQLENHFHYPYTYFFGLLGKRRMEPLRIQLFFC